jgi:hypothetical protein
MTYGSAPRGHMASHYDTQQICLSGHQINDSWQTAQQHNRDYCPTCGSKTIHKCPACGGPIQGRYHVDGFFSDSKTPVPSHCGRCGVAYPWTVAKSRLSNASAEIGPPESNALQLVLQICSRFHLVARQLNSRYGNRPTLEIDDEYDVQDLLYALLHIGFDDVRKEEYTPSYAGGASRADFLLAKEKIVVEAKKTRPTLKAKEVGEQLIIDIAKYRKHPDCKTLVCFVYDPAGLVANPRGLESDLSQATEDFTVRVLVVPKGY